ncbi:MAG: outer membrane beta-barrel protein [Burkholderiales bacterium]|nr:outer membrane beta-barrel protein [Burkholderiales bacterium]
MIHPRSSSASLARLRPTVVATLALAGVLAAAAALDARAQSSPSSGSSLLPWAQQGYVGINVGKPELGNDCGLGGFGCDDGDASVHLYTGAMFNQWLGLEVGYLNFGRAERAGGRTRAQGINLSAVARVPVGPVNLFAKGGGTYSRTEVTANALSGVPTGKASGWGAAYGGGVGYDFGRNSSVVLEYTRQDFEFAGVGRKAANATSLGYVYRF